MNLILHKYKDTLAAISELQVSHFKNNTGLIDEFMDRFDREIVKNEYELKLNLNSEQIDSVMKYMRYYASIINSMKSSQKTDLKKLFLLSEKIYNICISESSDNEVLIINQLRTSCNAFYYYKQNDFKRAQQLTLGCIEQLEILIDKGMSFAYFRVIQQNFTLINICLKEGDISKAISDMSSIIEHLFNGKSLLPICSERTARLWAVFDNEIKYFFAFQYFIIAEKLYSRQYESWEPVERRTIFKAMFCNIHFEPKNPILKWLELKTMFLDERYDDYLLAVLKYFRNREYEKMNSFEITCSIIEDFVRLLIRENINLDEGETKMLSSFLRDENLKIRLYSIR